MKTIKYLRIFLLITVLGIGLSSCGEDEYHTRLHELILNDLTGEKGFDKEGVYIPTEKTAYEKVFRNEDLSNYAATTDASWCHATIEADQSLLRVSVDPNDTFDDRVATVTISDIKDGVTSRTFQVSQKQCDVIMIGEGEYEVASEGGTVEITVESNVDYTVEILDADWVTLPNNATRGLVTSTVVLEVARNDSEEERTATVRIVDNRTGVEDITTIFQHFDPKFSVVKNSYTIDEFGGTVSIYVQTNVSFDTDLNPEDSWISSEGRESKPELDLVIQRLTVAPLTTKVPSRTTTVTLKNTTWDFSEKITITQTKNLYIKDEDFQLYTTQTKKLNLHNANGEAVSWKSSNTSVATVDSEGLVEAVGAGTATITVTSPDQKHTDNVKVTVVAPKDLDDKLATAWESNNFTKGDTTVVEKLSSTITNNSDFDIQMTKCTLFRDGKELKTVTYDATTGALASKGSLKAEFADLVMYEEVEVEVPDPETVEGEEGENSENADNGNSSSATGGGDAPASTRRARTRAIVKTLQIDLSPHIYYVVWEYSYYGENFIYRTEDYVATAKVESSSAAGARRSTRAAANTKTVSRTKTVARPASRPRTRR